MNVRSAPPIRPAYTVRAATAEDAPSIARLIATEHDLRQVSPYEEFPLEAPTVRYWIRERKAGHVLLERGDVVAYAELVPDASRRDRWWIGHMMVRADRRGLGLGRRLVLSLLQIAIQERDAREVAISAFEDNPAALRCYASCGFRVRGSGRVGDRMLVEMRFPVLGRRRVIPRAAVVPGAWVAVAFSVMLLPEPARRTLVEAGSPLRIGGLAVAALVVSAFAVSLQPILPERRTPRMVRWARVAAYPLAVAAASAVPAGIALRLWGGMSFARLADAIVTAVQVGATIGATWSIFLVLLTEFEPIWPRRRGRPPVED